MIPHTVSTLLRLRLWLPAVLLLLLAACDSGGGTEPVLEDDGTRGSIIEATLIESLTAQDVIGFGLPVAASYDVDLYRVVYRTIDPFGAPTQASGAVAVPRRAPGALPLVSYQHGTETARDQVASVAGSSLPEAIVVLAFAASGYFAAMPDYLGLGASEGLHPYVHGASLATATVDMLRAARRLAAFEEVALSGQLFLAGYSEGGYATAAAQRLIEAEHAGEFTITASAPMAGSYDMSGVMAGVMLERKAYPSPYYLPYTLLAYDAIYDLYPSLSEAFVAPYDALLPGLFDGSQGAGAINAQIPDVPLEMIEPAYLDAFMNQPDHPLWLALRDNDVYDWAPQAPTRLYHCLDDDLVPFQNAVVARDRFHALGATHVELVPLEAGGHVACAGPAILLGKFWFDTFLTIAVPAS